MSELQAPFNARFGQLFSRGSSYNWLLAYFFFNLALTIYNKVVLNGNFPFPYTLTAVHAFCGAVGSWLCLEQNIFSMPQLKKRESIQIILFSVLYTINIVTSNVSLYVLCLSYRANVQTSGHRAFPSNYSIHDALVRNCHLGILFWKVIYISNISITDSGMLNSDRF